MSKHNPNGIELRSKGKIYQIFDQISKKYDSANTLVSFAQDTRWRKKLIQHISLPSHEPPFVLLDLATGTGEILRLFTQAHPELWLTLGADLSTEMLLQARKKRYTTSSTPLFCVMDGLAMGIQSESIDVVTIAFGIRNFPAVSRALQEIFRVLKPEGQLLILEFGLPKSRWFKPIYMFYLQKMLPLLGGIWTGHIDAYRYLSKTICTFPSHEAFLDLLNEAGFMNTRYIPLQQGTVLLYIATKPYYH